MLFFHLLLVFGLYLVRCYGESYSDPIIISVEDGVKLPHENVSDYEGVLVAEVQGGHNGCAGVLAAFLVNVCLEIGVVRAFLEVSEEIVGSWSYLRHFGRLWIVIDVFFYPIVVW